MRELTEAEKQMAERQHRMKVDAVRHECNAPERHMKKTELDLKGAFGTYLNSIAGKLYTGFLIGICGERGNGKTQLSVEVMKMVMEQERSACYMTATKFFSRIKATFRKDSDENEEDVIKDLRRPKLLVIDEIGKRSDSQWENNQLFELINDRYNDLTDTILIDNRSKADFETALGPSLSSRMTETGGIIEASWESFRK